MGKFAWSMGPFSKILGYSLSSHAGKPETKLS